MDVLGLYLIEIGRYPLIGRDEEILLAQAIEKGNEAVEELDSGNDLSDARMRELHMVVRRGEAAERQFVQSNLRLVVSIARRYQVSGMPLLDLIQEGNLGLIRAVSKFDWSLGFKFSTYATWWIRQAISRGIANTGRTIRLPVHVGETLKRVRRARSRIEHECGRPVSLAELAIEAQVPEDTLEHLLPFELEPLSLSDPHDGDRHVDDFAESEPTDDPGLLSEIEDRLAPPIFEIVTRSLWRESVTGLLAVVDERKREILTHRFGLDGGEPRTLEEVGEHFNLTRERIRQLESEALKTLKNHNLKMSRLELFDEFV